MNMKPMKNVKSGNLALIEDDEDTSDLIEAFLKPHGFEVKVFTSSVDFIERLKTQPNQFDVIITDMMMPGMTGIELTQAIRNQNIETPVILVTANNNLDMAIQAIEAGAYDFILKPIPFPNFLLCVQRALYFSRIKGENKALKDVLQSKEGTGLSGVIGRSTSFRQALDLAKKVSSSMAHVLITGESGTGKEVIAKALHQLGNRSHGPFITINCSAIPETLLESELFGHAKGSFTGASDKKVGLFEEAEGGTLFLDEIGDMSLALQAKLLRVLQEKKIRRVGENQQRPIHVRVVSATHKNLRNEVIKKTFREDLFFRLNVIPIHIPPLRQRKDDILPLAEYFLKKYVALNNSKITAFSREASSALLSKSWPGNVRELENTIERAVVLCQGAIIEPLDLVDLEGEASEATPLDQIIKGDLTMKLEEVSKIYIQKVLEKNGGYKDKTAKDLGIDRKTLYRKLTQIESENMPELHAVDGLDNSTNEQAFTM